MQQSAIKMKLLLVCIAVCYPTVSAQVSQQEYIIVHNMGTLLDDCIALVQPDDAMDKVSVYSYTFQAMLNVLIDATFHQKDKKKLAHFYQIFSHMAAASFAFKTRCPIFKNPQQGNLRLSGLLSGQGVGGGARTRDRRVPADLRADSLATVPPKRRRRRRRRGRGRRKKRWNRRKTRRRTKRIWKRRKMRRRSRRVECKWRRTKRRKENK
ncbi:hypothetical protein PoB_002815700 [Plakobranchus ocellatus]|uniref:Uncharacterized protein n=1 Tax=Plakobranchus ocellatus TaxID=259542 RepID=A0AAV4A439_9GAST|nr:hypothetical protein PoB_002815700 [Plakobranchus ocellatus]